MPRADLLALTPDDLAAITNRGTVKRAERELEAGGLTCELAEEAGSLTVRWSDGIVCTFPGGKTMHEAACTSGIAGISRHVVRSVLAYQKHCRAKTASDEAATAGDDQSSAAAPASPAWDPGAITDDALAGRFRQAALVKARQRFAQGVLVELVRGVKPLARFLDAPCTLRFLVPGDLRYITADCDESLLATYVPMAVWAFRHLPPDQMAGLVALQQSELAVPTDLLADLDALLTELCISGIAGCGPTWPQRLTRLEEDLRTAGLVWPAELSADLFEQHAMYRAHDARFDPLEVVAVVGELLARARAIAQGTKEVPQLLIRGSTHDRETEIAGGRMIGLGLGVRLGRRVTTLSAFVQDANSGGLAVVERSFADPAEDSRESPKSYAELGGTVLSRGVSLAALSRSQLLLKTGKRTPSGRLVLPRTAASLTINPQTFAWEQLKPPAAVENFEQLAARLKTLPPSYLRPRRMTENLHVCPVQSVEEVRFNESQQRLEAVLRDARGGTAQLVHPFHSRGRAGFDSLLAALENYGPSVRFVSGHMTGASAGLMIRPILVVVEEDDRRIAIQPLVGEAAAASGTATAASSTESSADENVEPADPLESFLAQVRFELSELLLSGVRRADHFQAKGWNELLAQGRQLGFIRLMEPIAHLADLLSARAETIHWDPVPAAMVVLKICILARIARDAH
jgi:hypothetical protein